jgi:hypothetical protein
MINKQVIETQAKSFYINWSSDLIVTDVDDNQITIILSPELFLSLESRVIEKAKEIRTKRIEEAKKELEKADASSDTDS